MPDTTPSKRIRTAMLQAHALAELFEVSVTRARDTLAQAAYGCDHWHELQDRIQGSLLDPTERTLLYVSEDRQARRHFEQMLDGLIERLSRAVSTDHLGLIQLRKGVYKAFTTKEKAFTFPELFPVVAMPAWRNVNIGPQPNAILTADLDIEGQAYRLLAFRTCREPRTSDKTDFARCLNIIPVSGHIVWAKRKQWERGIRELEAPGNRFSRSIRPMQALSGVMSQFETWFEELRDHVSDVLLGTGEKRLVMPLLLKGMPYIVVGFPVVSKPDSGTPPSSYEYPRIVCIDDIPLVIDKACVPARQNSPGHALFEGLALGDEEGVSVIARSASLADIEFVLDLRYRQEFLRQDESIYEWSSATASPQLAMDIIEKVARHGTVQSQSAAEVEVVFDEPIVVVGKGSQFCVLAGGTHDNRKPTALWIRGEPEGEGGAFQPVKKFIVDQDYWKSMRLSWGNMDERRKRWLVWSRR